MTPEELTMAKLKKQDEGDEEELTEEELAKKAEEAERL